MSLITCPECHKKISTSVDCCPKCGFKLNPDLIKSIKEKEKKFNKRFNIGCLAIVIFFCLSFAIGKLFENGSSNSIPNVKISGYYVTKCKCYGAKDKATLEKASDMLNIEDNVAFNKMLLSGKIIDIPEGTRVLVEDSALFGKARIRVIGEVQSLWVYSVWLLKD